MGIPSIATIPSIPSIGGGVYDRTTQFLRTLYDVSPGSIRAIWLPLSGDTTTTTTEFDGRVWTYDADITARISTQGQGIIVSFNGTSNEADTPDTANTSFGDASNDSPLSIVSLANITDTAADRVLFAKYNIGGAAREYAFLVNGTGDTLQLNLYDESDDKQPVRTSDAAITQGALHLFAATYDGGGGATAMDGVTLYEDAAVIASTATNDIAYVAMENTAALPSVGALAAAVAPFAGTMGFCAVYAAELSAAQLATIKAGTNFYYGTSL